MKMEQPQANKTKFSDSGQAKKYYLLYLLGISAVSSGHYAILSLQSSLNVEGGLGTICLAVHYASTLICGLIGAPILLHFVNIKFGLVLFDISALIYCAANFYAETFTLIPASIISGLAKALLWICTGSFIVYFAKKFEQFGKGNAESRYSDVSGYNFAALQSAQIVGNFIPYFVFKFDEPSNAQNTTTTMQNTTITDKIYELERPPILQICGAKDCQDPNITEKTISKYVPSDAYILYIVLSVFLALNIIGLSLHILFAPSGEQDTREKIPRKRDIGDANSGLEDIDTLNAEQELFMETNLEKFQAALTEVKFSLMHYVKPYQLLLTGLQIHSGFDRAFVYGEFTRAYVSCVYGVTQVGISMSIYTTSGFVTSLIVGKLASKFGRKLPFLLQFVFTVGLYIFCLRWNPTENSSVWVAYVTLLAYGFTQSIGITMTMASCAAFYPKENKRAFSCWIVWGAMASVVQFGWSTSLCVSTKIYCLLATLCFGMATQAIAEYMKAKEEKMQTECEDADNKDELKILKSNENLHEETKMGDDISI